MNVAGKEARKKNCYLEKYTRTGKQGKRLKTIEKIRKKSKATTTIFMLRDRFACGLPSCSKVLRTCYELQKGCRCTFNHVMLFAGVYSTDPENYSNNERVVGCFFPSVEKPSIYCMYANNVIIIFSLQFFVFHVREAVCILPSYR